MRARTRWLVAAAVVLTAGLIVTAVAFGLSSARTQDASAPSTEISSTAQSETSVCGFAGELISKIVADRPSGGEMLTPRSWEIDGDGNLGGLAIAGDAIVVQRNQRSDGSNFLRYSRDGRLLDSVHIAIARSDPSEYHDNGAWAVGDDGSVYAIDSYDGHRDVVVFGPDGRESDRFPVPESAESTDHPHDLEGVTWVQNLDGAPAVLVGEGTRTVHGFRPGGASLGLVEGLPDAVMGATDTAHVFGLSAVAGATDIASLRVTNASTGTLSLQVPMRTSDPEFGASSTPAPTRLGSVAPGPGGDGFLVSDEGGVSWVDALGVRQGIWLSGQSGISLASPASLVGADGTYWALAVVDGQERVVVLTADEMRALMVEPVDLNAGIEPDLAQLGIGIGPTTSGVFNHFDAGETPAVRLRAERGWGDDVPGADTLELRYTVRGDPTLPAPTLQDARTADLPVGGGEVALELPQTRPGVYEVDLALVDTITGLLRAGTCLRYTVGAPGAELNLDDVSTGADWGGAAPLRGVELADRLGVGSHRAQLDLDALLDDPSAVASPAAVDWSALPGATEGDPFEGLRAAGVYAAANDVDLVLQLGRSGGESETAAVEAGTWAGWVSVIVGELARRIPEITHWAAWNEPNIGEFASGADYADRVEIPFADAAHAANPDAFVLGVNSLGFAIDWWREAVTTNVCAHIDAIAVHPYTGWNRSWEEEGYPNEGAGYDALRDAIGPDCQELPIWDTESGWTGDGASAFWAQGSNVARKLLWYEQEQIAGWTYFFSEGGWGENDLSWSLMQYGAYLKPGALAFAATTRMLADRGAPETVDTGIPFTRAMRVPGDDALIAVWTDEARMPATVSTNAASLTVTDQYGATDDVALSNGAAEITLTATPHFFRAAAGAEISFAAAEAFGPDLLEGRKVEASSTHVEADPMVITSGTADPFRPWRSGLLEGDRLDEAPTVTIALDSPTVIDRIAVASGNIVCCEAGLRHYVVSVQDEDGEWRVVAEPDDLFWERTTVLAFTPVRAIAVRVAVPWTTVRDTRVLDVNYTGFAGGLPPPFMGLETTSDYVVAIAAIQAWAPAP